MKKFLPLSILLVAILALCCPIVGGRLAHAETNDMYYAFEADGVPMSFVNIVRDSRPVGVRFGGYYFGDSGIAVAVDVYGIGGLPLDFAVGAKDLTEAQRAACSSLAELFAEIHRYINGIDELANTGYNGKEGPGGTRPLSDVYRYNNIREYGTQTENGYRLQISKDTFCMLQLAQEMYVDTQGAYNPAVYRLVDLWGFSSRIYSNGDFGLPYDRKVSSDEFWQNGYPLPDEKYVQAFSDPAFTDFSEAAVALSTDGQDYFVTKNVAPATVDGVEFEQWIDLGGIAKGYAVDGVKQMLAEHGIDRYNVDAGSSSLGYGLDYDGQSSTVGISDATDPLSSIFPTALVSLEVENCSMSTSGQNVRRYVTGGVEYSHILDGTTGEPAQTGVRAVTVIVPDDAGSYWAAKSDCLTTALTVMGRDRIVELANGYLAEKNIKILVIYITPDGRKQLLSNLDESEVTPLADSYSQFGWAMKKDADGRWYYDADADFSNPVDANKVLMIVAGCLLGAAVVALVVCHLVRGRKRVIANLQNAKRDKPFKIGDLLVYLGVVLVVAVLFAVFVFTPNTDALQTVTVTDEQTGETLFFYNFQRNEYIVNNNSSSGWTVTCTATGNGLTVRFTKLFDGEERFNELTVVRGRSANVKMTDALCGFHRDCVRTFAAITRPGGAIVCSPNRLKVVTA